MTSTSILPRNVARRFLLSLRGQAEFRSLSTTSSTIQSAMYHPSPKHPFQKLQYQPNRTMVIVTKTSSSEISPGFAPVDSTSSSDTSWTGMNPETETSTSDEQLVITPSCIKQVHALLKKRKKTPDEMFLRVFVDAGGCSGFTYKFELDDEFIPEEDKVFAPPGSDGARVVVDETSLNLIQGSKIDYVQEMIKSAFVVAENPQSESACGCGSSFAVKNFSANPAKD